MALGKGAHDIPNRSLPIDHFPDLRSQAIQLELSISRPWGGTFEALDPFRHPGPHGDGIVDDDNSGIQGYFEGFNVFDRRQGQRLAFCQLCWGGMFFQRFHTFYEEWFADDSAI